MRLWERLWSFHYPEILRLIRPDTACQAVFLLNLWIWKLLSPSLGWTVFLGVFEICGAEFV